MDDNGAHTEKVADVGDAEQVSDVADATQLPAPEERGNNRWAVMRVVILLTGTSIGGVLLGGAVQLSRSGGTVQRTAQLPAEQPDESQKKALPRSQLRAADELLVQGNVGEALEIYGRIGLGSANAVQHSQILYRVGVAHELSGALEQANGYYQQVTAAARDRRLGVAARLAQARVLVLQERYGPAIEQLSELASHAEIAYFPGSELAAAHAHLLGVASSLFALASADVTATPALFRPRGSATPSVEYSPVDLLVAPNVAEDGTRAELPTGVSVIYQLGPSPDQIQLRASLPDSSAIVTAEQIGAATGISIRWADEARELAALKRRALVSSNSSMASLLDQIVLPLGLDWYWNESGIIVHRRDSLEADQLRRTRELRASRYVRFALANHPSHHLAAYAQLLLGNVALQTGDLPVAETSFRQLLEPNVEHPVQVEAAFNLAKTLHARGKTQLAADMYFHAADLGQGHPLRAVAYYHVGKLLFESGKLTESTRPLMRAVSLSDRGFTKGASAVALAAHYLLNENPHAANKVLMKARDEFNDQQLRRAAALVASLARLTVAEPSSQAWHGRDVVAAVNQVTPDDFLGSFGYLVMGDAFEKTGQLRQLVTLFESTREQEVPPWVRDQIHTALADYYSGIGAYEHARRLLTELVNSANQPLSEAAVVQLVEMDLLEQRLSSCLQRGRELLAQDLRENNKAKVMQLMGRAYQFKGDHYEAALCFAGMIPPLEVRPTYGHLEHRGNPQ